MQPILRGSAMPEDLFSSNPSNRQPASHLWDWSAGGLVNVSATPTAHGRRLRLEIALATECPKAAIILRPLDRSRLEHEEDISRLKYRLAKLVPLKPVGICSRWLDHRLTGAGRGPASQGMAEFEISEAWRRMAVGVSISIIPVTACVSIVPALWQQAPLPEGLYAERTKSEFALGRRRFEAEPCLLTSQQMLGQRLEWVLRHFDLLNDSEISSIVRERLLPQLYGGYATALLKRDLETANCREKRAIRKEVEKLVTKYCSIARAEQRRRVATCGGMLSRGRKQDARPCDQISTPPWKELRPPIHELIRQETFKEIRRLVELHVGDEKLASLIIDRLCHNRPCKDLAIQAGMTPVAFRSRVCRVREFVRISLQGGRLSSDDDFPRQ